MTMKLNPDDFKQFTKSIVISTTSGKQVFKNQWVNKKDRRGFVTRFEILDLYEDLEEARVKMITPSDGYLYTVKTFHSLGLKRVLL